jgi:chromosomal replication initiation ATPase DnaA
MQLSQKPLIISPRYKNKPQEFISSACNIEAFQLIEAWPAWHYPKQVCIWGGKGSGKTYLAHILSSKSGTEILSGHNIESVHPFDIKPVGGLIIIDNADLIASNEWLFNFYNYAFQGGMSVLYTAQKSPSQWTVTLPDLASRLGTVHAQEIYNPDDFLLFEMVRSNLKQRGFLPPDNLIQFIVTRAERSFEGIHDFMERVDVIAASLKKPLNRNMVLEALNHEETQGFMNLES